MVAAAVTQYRQEYVASFEQHVSRLRGTATTEMVKKGNVATFVVTGSGGATAVTRGSNGRIPYSQLSNSQVSATLSEKHAPFEMTGFNIFASQGDQRRAMQKNSVGTINRDIDDVILAELGNGTVNTGTAVAASLSLVTRAKAILGTNDVDLEDMDNIFAVISPAFEAYLQETTEFSSGDFVETKPLAGPSRRYFRWAGINWYISSRVSGVGTNAEKCFMYHRSAIGHAVDLVGDNVFVGYDEKEDISWTRATLFHGAKLLQNSGVVVMNHDGSAKAAA